MTHEWCTSHEDAPERRLYGQVTDMSWIRNTQEAGERRPIDTWRLGFCGLTVVLLGVWAQSQSAINVDFFTPINGLGDDIVGLAKAVYALGSIWAALAVVVLLLRGQTADARAARRAGRGCRMGHRAARQRDRRHAHDPRRAVRAADRRRTGLSRRPCRRDRRDRVRARPRSRCGRCAGSSGCSCSSSRSPRCISAPGCRPTCWAACCSA